MMYKKEFENSKMSILELLEELNPDLRHIMRNHDGELLEVSMMNMAEFVSKHCYNFDCYEKEYASLFIQVAIQYLYYACNDDDFTFVGLYKLIKTIDPIESQERYISTFEIMLEEFVKQDIPESTRNDVYELLKISNYRYISDSFQETMERSVKLYKTMFMEAMIREDFYIQANQMMEKVIYFLKKQIYDIK